MSLINAKNFLAPFQNKIAMGALLMIALLIFAARISGSSLSSTKDRTAPRTAEVQDQSNPKVAASIEDFLAGQRRKSGVPVATQDDFLGDLLKEEPAAPEAPKEEPGPKGLNDIKKSLGLE